jgi:hypothetical protein
MRRKNKFSMKNLPVDAPLYHTDHSRPVTRRDFIRQGFALGSASYLSGGIFSLFAAPNQARAALSPDMTALAADIGCSFGLDTGSVPMICFDLAGGANFAGSNVLVGGAGGQNDGTITTAGYSKLGIPGDMVPGLDSTGLTQNTSTNNDFVNDDLGLLFHADSAMLAGILEKAGAAIGNVDGCVIPARSDNDTGNNPHNPLYGVAIAGARGSVVDLIGSRNSESGGNSVAPANMVNPEFRPTKVDRSSDVTGMVDVGDLTATLSNPADVTAVMESIARISHKKLRLGTIHTGLGITPTGIDNDEVVKDLIRCGYLKAADLADRFAGVAVDPLLDTNIVDDSTGIFTNAEMGDGEFQKTASIMKMVLNGYSAAGCVTMGGYDYHTSDRSTGEARDLRAGRCIGACLNYAQRVGSPVMIYVFSDGSVASNGTRDNSTDGRGKGVWSGDNSSTACSFFLVYNPNTQPNLLIPGRQIGRFSSDASVVTSSSPAANNVNLLVNTVLLNYMALNNQLGLFTTKFPNHGLGSGTSYEQFVAFDPIIT